MKQRRCRNTQRRAECSTAEPGESAVAAKAGCQRDTSPSEASEKALNASERAARQPGLPPSPRGALGRTGPVRPGKVRIKGPGHQTDERDRAATASLTHGKALRRRQVLLLLLFGRAARGRSTCGRGTSLPIGWSPVRFAVKRRSPHLVIPRNSNCFLMPILHILLFKCQCLASLRARRTSSPAPIAFDAHDSSRRE